MCTLYELHSGEDTAEEGIIYLYTQHVVYVANGAVVYTAVQEPCVYKKELWFLACIHKCKIVYTCTLF